MLNNGSPLSVAYNDGEVFFKDKQVEVKNSSYIPKVGMIILYNEIIKWRDRKMPRPYRGCGVVSFETEHLIFIDRTIFPGCFIKTSFPKTDFELGLVKYVQLKCFIYNRDVSYSELNISNLNKKIKALVI